ncbi:hypothetical protein [Tahibacter sp.]|uniref:hypothetical protein n=1 Tax=Tahibacter sp. TaxID=2056211 RepID=UPI0028C48F7A|nr:hypothetical protein [Tahibacter sp.]
MLTISRTLILLLALAVLAGACHADDFMLGGGAAPGGVALAQSRQDCDIPPTSSARVIYHDGQRAPVSVPMDARGSVSDDVATIGTPAESASSAPASAVSLPSAEAAVPQKPRGGGLRWQSVLPGSIK